MGKEAEGKRRVALAALVLVMAAQAVAEPAAWAEAFGPDVVAVLHGENQPADRLTFVGRSGQIYESVPPTWARTHVGGIARSAVGALRDGSSIFVIPESAPMFERANGVWQARNLDSRGDMVFAADGARVLVGAGRYLYGRERGQWKRLLTADRQITAALGLGKDRYLVATTRGRLRRFEGKGTVVIKNDMPTEEHVVSFAGRSGFQVGLTNRGSVYRIGPQEAVAMTFEGALAGMKLQVLGHGPAGEALAVALVPDGAAEPARALLVELAEGGPKEVAALPLPAPGDRYTVLHVAADKALVVASYRGVVRIRRAGSQEWEERRVSGEVPKASGKTGPGSVPARTP